MIIRFIEDLSALGDIELEFTNSSKNCMCFESLRYGIHIEVTNYDKDYEVSATETIQSLINNSFDMYSVYFTANFIFKNNHYEICELHMD